MATNIFKYSDYKLILQEKIQENSETRGYQSRLAEAAKCQRSFLSQVLKSHVHLTPDQAANIAVFWSLDALETEYFLDLVNLERSQSQHLKDIIEKRLSENKRRRLKVSNRKQSTAVVSQEDTFIFLSHWLLPLVHIFLTIEEYQDPTNFEKIADKLDCDKRLVISAVEKLHEIGLVARVLKKGEISYQPTETDLSIPEESDLVNTYHNNIRQIIAEKIRRDENRDAVCYTGVFSIRSQDAEKIKTILLEAIKECKSFTYAEPQEEVYLLTSDFFQIS